MRAGRAIAALLLLAVAACAPRLVPPGEPLEPPALAPDAAAPDAYVTADGARLPLRVWRPEGAPGAVIVALHGFNDYGRAFDEPAARWAEDGLLTFAYDQRGFGEAPHRGYWPGVEAYTGDLSAFSRLVRRRFPDAPLYLVGESMGAAVIMAALASDDPPAADGVVLAAPAVWGRETMNPIQTGALWIAAHTVPWLTLSGRGLRIRASDNVEMLRRLAKDPLVIKETRVDTLNGLVDLMDAAFAAAPRLDGVPALILYGDRDEVVPPEPVKEMLRRLPAGDGLRVALYPEGYHMLLRDLQAETVIDDVAAWIVDSARPLPSGAAAPLREIVVELGGEAAEDAAAGTEAEGLPAAAGFAGRPALE